MITRRKRYVYGDCNIKGDCGILKDVVLDKKDYGVSFCDLATECDIEGHEPDIFSDGGRDFVQRCKICGLERDVKLIQKEGVYAGRDLIQRWHPTKLHYGEWYDSDYECYECEENCIISRPMDYFKCPNCHRTHSWELNYFDGFLHTNGDDKLLYDCLRCNTKDQVIA